MQHRELKFSILPLADLKPAEYNPRKLTAAERENLTRSIQERGFIKPLIVNTNNKRKNILIDGHQRLDVLREIGVQEVPCILVNCTEAEEKAVNVSLNKNLGSWDWEKLVKFFPVDDLVAFGFSSAEIQPHLRKNKLNTDDDAIPDVVNGVCKAGDLWALGDHRLYCGDCRDVSIFGDVRFDMVLTDPPYGVDYSGKNEMLNKLDGGGKMQPDGRRS